ncbi:hypothetical protein [Clostridium sp.]|nr:hypothetical protein [Clostridium sp.]MBS5307693.1 hypothetical protein [Clostridium sp.]
MKKEIIVEVEGEITDSLIWDFNNRLAIALISQYGREGATQILEVLKGE